MSTRSEQFRRRLDKLELAVFPYRGRKGFFQEELLEYLWLTNPEWFRQEAERKNPTFLGSPTLMKAIMNSPPRRDREQFIAWMNGIASKLEETSEPLDQQIGGS
jgi:hypothetical protein